MATIDGFKSGCYTPEDYTEILKEDGIEIKRR